MLNHDDEKLVPLKEWERTHPHFCRMNNGVIDRLDDNYLEDESLGSGFAEMLKLCEAILNCIRTRISTCLKKTICKR